MHDALVTLHNENVKPNDHVSFLGDITIKRGGRLDREWFIAEMKRYHGHKRAYLGNHDHFPMQVYLDAGFEKVYASWRSEEGFICSHIPLHPFSLSTAKANVHGHIHQAKNYPPAVVRRPKYGMLKMVPYMNVSVEVTNYKPVHLDEILAMIKKYDAYVVDEEKLACQKMITG